MGGCKISMAQLNFVHPSIAKKIKFSLRCNFHTSCLCTIIAVFGDPNRKTAK